MFTLKCVGCKAHAESQGNAGDASCNSREKLSHGDYRVTDASYMWRESNVQSAKVSRLWRPQACDAAMGESCQQVRVAGELYRNRGTTSMRRVWHALVA